MSSAGPPQRRSPPPEGAPDPEWTPHRWYVGGSFRGPSLTDVLDCVLDVGLVVDGDVRVDVGENGVRLDAPGCLLAAAVVEQPELCSLVAALVSGGVGTAARAQCDRTVGRPRCRFALSLPESPTAR